MSMQVLLCLYCCCKGETDSGGRPINPRSIGEDSSVEQVEQGVVVSAEAQGRLANPEAAKPHD